MAAAAETDMSCMQLLILKCGQGAPQIRVGCLGNCCSSSGGGLPLKLLLLRHGQASYLDAAPWMGEGCSQGCCSLDRGELFLRLILLSGGGTHTVTDPPMVVGCLRGCCFSDGYGLCATAASRMEEGCSLDRWVAHSADASQKGLGCTHGRCTSDRGKGNTHSFCSLDRSRPCEAATFQHEAGCL